MSPRKARKPADAAAFARPAVHSTLPTPGAQHTRLQAGSAGHSAPEMNPHSLLWTGAPRVGGPRNSDPARFDDPCIYLG